MALVVASTAPRSLSRTWCASTARRRQSLGLYDTVVWLVLGLYNGSEEAVDGSYDCSEEAVTWRMMAQRRLSFGGGCRLEDGWEEAVAWRRLSLERLLAGGC
jgi:hypothetical protein